MMQLWSIFVDRLPKMVHFAPTHTTCSAHDTSSHVRKPWLQAFLTMAQLYNNVVFLLKTVLLAGWELALRVIPARHTTSRVCRLEVLNRREAEVYTVSPQRLSTYWNCV